MTYFLVKLAHIVCSTILMWTLGASVLGMFLANRLGDRDLILQAARVVTVANLAVTTPALVIQFGTGAALLFVAQFNPAELWIFSGVILYVLALAFWVPTVGLQIRMRRLAAEAVEKDVSLGPDYLTIEKRWTLAAGATFLALAAVFYFMIYKPTGH